MSETKHTPGPWESRFGEAYTVRDIADGQICTLHWLNGPSGLGGRRKSEEVEANACLIAAAPMLIAAAQRQEAAEAFHLACDECEGNEIPELCEACFPHYDDARIARRAAIAKATAHSSQTRQDQCLT